jgi:hypothetical protein
MSLGGLLALLCIILGFLSAILDEAILFKGPGALVSLCWFVAALAIVAVLGGVGPVLFGRKPEA